MSVKAVVVANANKAKGYKWERDIREHLRGEGLDVEALRQLGTQDEGDMVIRSTAGLRFVVEAKNHKQMRLSEYLREVRAECDTYVENRDLASERVFPAAIVKAQGKGVGDGYVVMNVNDYAAMLRAFDMIVSAARR